MHLDQQTVSARGSCGFRHRRDVGTMTGSMTWIDDDGKMRQLTEHRYRAQVERVARTRLEGSYPPLAQHHLLIADGEDVLGGAEPFVDGAREPALEQDRAIDLAELAQQVEVLHVPGPNLEHVDHLRHSPDLVHRHDLADDRHTRSPAGRGEQFETRPAESLEGVRRGPRLEHSTPQDLRARFANRTRGGVDLTSGLDGAWARHDEKPAATDQQIPDRNHRVVGPRAASRQPVILRRLGRRTRWDKGFDSLGIG